MKAAPRVPAQSAIEFTLPGDPVAWSRAGRNGGITYPPPKQAAYARTMGWAAKAVMKGAGPLAGPVSLTVQATYTVPTSWPQAKKLAAVFKPSVADLDNIVKQVSDALNKIAYADDAQICQIIAMKVYGPVAQVFVRVESLCNKMED